MDIKDLLQDYNTDDPRTPIMSVIFLAQADMMIQARTLLLFISDRIEGDLSKMAADYDGCDVTETYRSLFMLAAEICHYDSWNAWVGSRLLGELNSAKKPIVFDVANRLIEEYAEEDDCEKCVNRDSCPESTHLSN